MPTAVRLLYNIGEIIFCSNICNFESVKDLVLIGGGHSHAIVLKMFGLKPLPSVRLTLISDVLYAPYSGMLPAHVAGFYDYDECHIDLRSLAAFAGCQILVDWAIAIDLNKNLVICQTHPPVNFDVLSVDIGSTPAALSVPGAAKYAIAAKPVPEFLASWNQLISERQNHPQKPLRIAIVGGGAGGVELALNMQSRLGKEEGFGNGLCNGFNGCQEAGRSSSEAGRRNRESKLKTQNSPSPNLSFYSLDWCGPNSFKSPNYCLGTDWRFRYAIS